MSLRDAASSFITRLISCIQTNGKVSLSESSRHSVSVVCVCVCVCVKLKMVRGWIIW